MRSSRGWVSRDKVELQRQRQRQHRTDQLGLRRAHRLSFTPFRARRKAIPLSESSAYPSLFATVALIVATSSRKKKNLQT